MTSPAARLDLLEPGFRDAVAEAAGWLTGRGFGGAAWGLVLGSGLGDLVDAVEDARREGFGAVPGFADPTVPEHAGGLVRGRLGRAEVVVLQGRLHPYEGRPAARTLLPTAVLAALGVSAVVVTNAAGGLNRHYRPGDLMVIRDQLDMHTRDPLHGLLARPLAGSPMGRASSAVGLFDPALARRLARAAARAGVPVHAGTYCSMPGPAYETRAEIGLLRRAHGDAVGMSTAPEAALLHRLGLRVAGLSCITNPARETGQPALSHDDVVEVGRRVRESLARLLLAFLDGGEPA